ncbi:MAG: hypothetical protein K2H53_04990 [Clostridia bacterium]|nr:hypothetical protein [Clostridia bacterium]
MIEEWIEEIQEEEIEQTKVCGLKGAIYIAIFLLVLRNYCIFCNNKNI